MSKRFTVIFCGTPEFAVPSLKALAADPAYEVVLVVTQPDKPVGRKKELTAPPVKVAAQNLGLPVFQPEKINDELAAHMREQGIATPDFLVVVAYGAILSEATLAIPAVAPVNVHASLLPRWRGASPIEHAIMTGDRETGVTVQEMVRALDAGPILAQATLPLGPRDATPAVKERLSTLGAGLLAATLKKPLHPLPQPETGITVCRKLSREDGVVDPALQTAEDIDRKVRALNPWPGVTCTVEGREVKIIASSLSLAPHAVALPCAEGTTLFLVTVQEAGKRAMAADAWKRGIGTLLLVLGMMATGLGAQAQDFQIKDLDGDGLPDTVEDANGNGTVDSGETDPRNADTDRGGEADGSEIHGKRNPFDPEDDMTFDRDKDGLTNGQELILNTDPKKPDTDGDGVQDGADPFPLEQAYKADANKNGLPDEWEVQNKLAPAGASASSSSRASSAPGPAAPSASGAGGAAIAQADPDGDRLTNAQEFNQGTDPRASDTDRDGTPDGEEVEKGSNPDESACLSFQGDTAPLPDILEHWSRDTVTQLQRVQVLPTREPIIRGYKQADGYLFLPDRNVSRFEFLKMALFSSCIKLLGPDQSKTPFPDVSAARPHETADRALQRRVIATAVAEGIVQGYPDGHFRPDAPVTRAEALKMLLLSTRLTPLPEEHEAIPFPDVPPDAWHRGYVEQAYDLRLIEGYTDGTFHPDASITRAEAAKIIHYALLTNPGVNGYVIPSE